MRHEIEASHQKYKVDDANPVFFKHDLALPDKLLSLCSFFAFFLCFTELFRVGEDNTKESDGKGKSSAEPKDGSPGVRTLGDEVEVDNGSDEVAECVAYTMSLMFF